MRHSYIITAIKCKDLGIEISVVAFSESNIQIPSYDEFILSLQSDSTFNKIYIIFKNYNNCEKCSFKNVKSW